MKLIDLRWTDLDNKKIRRASWADGEYLLVFGWRFAGPEENYGGPNSESPYGLLFLKDGTRKPFDIYPGHKGDDWEIL